MYLMDKINQVLKQATTQDLQQIKSKWGEVFGQLKSAKQSVTCCFIN